jgi:hypothetical protein
MPDCRLRAVLAKLPDCAGNVRKSTTNGILKIQKYGEIYSGMEWRIDR